MANKLDEKLAIENGSQAMQKIFTYTSDDNYESPSEIKSGKSKFKEIFEYQEICSEELITTNNKDRLVGVNDNFTVMYIMVEFEIEQILFLIKYRKYDGLLIIYPDFNDIGQNSYLIEVDSDSRHLYHYSITNLSNQIQLNESSNVDEIKLISNKVSEISINYGNSLFELAPLDRIVVFIFFEILTASNFGNNNIHIKYNLKLPLGCNVIDGELEGCSHSQIRNMSDNFNIGHCHTIGLILQQSEYNKNIEIKVYYEVVSIDSFNRFKSEGRSYLSIPLSSGIYNKLLNCYRELSSNSYYESIKRFFFNGRYLFNVFEFNGNSTSTKLNRYANYTTTTGDLNVKYQIIVQNYKNNLTSIAQHSKQNHFVAIDDIVKSYYQARNRLEAIAPKII